MLTHYPTILIALVLMSMTLNARVQNNAGPSLQQDGKALRTFVEGDALAIPTVIEEMRRRAGESGLRIIFLNRSTDPYDVRLILTFGSGRTWDTNPNARPGDIRLPVPFAFGTVIALMPDGQPVFTAAGSGNTLQSASIAVATEIISNLQKHSGAHDEKHSVTGSGEPDSQKPGAPYEAKSSTGRPIPGEPGIYYEGPDGWVRLERVSPSGVESKGVGKALLTWGTSAVRVVQLYEGAQSRLQIRDRKPTFYVRGFAVSEQGGEIVRLAKKNAHREILAASIKPFNAKAGYSEHDRDEIINSRVSSDVVAITPRTELKSGEFLLSFSRLELSYDFGIVTEKR